MDAVTTCVHNVALLHDWPLRSRGGSSFSQAATLAKEEAFSVILAIQLLNLSHRPNAFHPQQGSAFNQSSIALITILIPRHHGPIHLQRN